MKNKSLIFGLIILIFLIYAVFRVIQTYNKLNPFLNNLFEKSEDITYNQNLEDSIFAFKDINNRVYKINTKKKDFVLHFWNLDNRLCIREMSSLNTHFLEKPTLSNKLLIITDDSISKINKFIVDNKLTFKIYKYDTALLPLKYKSLIFPYTLIIKGDSINMAFVANKELFNNEINKLK